MPPRRRTPHGQIMLDSKDGAVNVGRILTPWGRLKVDPLMLLVVADCYCWSLLVLAAGTRPRSRFFRR